MQRNKEKEVPNKPTDLEPTAFHSNSVDFYKELYHSFWAATVVDYTPLNEHAALAAMLLNKPYVGITINEYHQTELRKRLVRVQAPVRRELRVVRTDVRCRLVRRH